MPTKSANFFSITKIGTKLAALALGTAIALPVAVAPISADAGQRHWQGQHQHKAHRGKHRRHHRRHNNNGDLLAVGIIGLAVGAIIAGNNNYRQNRADHIYHSTPAPLPPHPVSVYQPYPSYNHGPNYSGVVHDPAYVGPVPHGQPVVISPQYQPQYGNRRYQPQYQTLPDYSRRHAPKAPSAPRAPQVITYDSAMNGGNLEPWSPGWKSYCRGKYRSFNAKSGTFLGYDGKRHFCVVK